MKQRATIVDVARQANVSTQTVSRVINNKGEISPATRQRVVETIQALGYRPNNVARGLASRRTRSLGLLVPDITNPFFSGVARGIEDLAHEHGYTVFVCNAIEDTQREAEMFASLEDKQVDGIIVCSPRLPDEKLFPLLERHSASIVVNRRVQPAIAGMVRVDAFAGARLAVQHLLRQKRRVIAFLAGPETSFVGHERIRGYTDALEEAGQIVDPALIVHCPPYLYAGKQATSALLSAQRGIDGLICYNDVIAIGALQACTELGLHIPERIALIGFDDIPFAAFVTPALTTLRVPIYAIGTRAAQMLFERLEGKMAQQEIILTPELVVRASAP